MDRYTGAKKTATKKKTKNFSTKRKTVLSSTSEAESDTPLNTYKEKQRSGPRKNSDHINNPKARDYFPTEKVKGLLKGNLILDDVKILKNDLPIKTSKTKDKSTDQWLKESPNKVAIKTSRPRSITNYFVEKDLLKESRSKEALKPEKTQIDTSRRSKETEEAHAIKNKSTHNTGTNQKGKASMDHKGDYHKCDDIKEVSKEEVAHSSCIKVNDINLGNISISECTEENVLYRCPEIGSEVLPKDVWYDRFRHYVDLISESDNILASIIAIKSLNSKEDADDCIEILETYLLNLARYPDEKKFKELKFDNNILQEKVLNVEGAGTFLTAVGFNLLENNKDKQYYFVYLYNVNESEILEIVDLMQRAEGFKLELVVSKEMNPLMHPSCRENSKEFLKLTGTEIKDSVLRGKNFQGEYQLRAKKERNKKAIKRVPSSKWSQIKVRLPSGENIQGSFSIDDKLSAIKSFIDEKTAKCKDFTLFRPAGEPFTEPDYEKSLEELELFPAVLLNLKWNSELAPKEKQDKLNRSLWDKKRGIKQNT